jgi:DmsE family decaheme c-type cytochrome
MNQRKFCALLSVIGAITGLLASWLVASAATAHEPDGDESYLALAAYVREIEQASPAEGDSDLSTLLHFVQDKLDKGKERPAARPKPAAAAKAPADAVATYVGSQECAVCHVKQTEDYSRTLHGRIFLKNPRTPQEKFGCESCHGPGSEHVRLGGGLGVGGIVAFRDNAGRPVEERNAVCLSCHERGLRTYWRASTHETRGLACTNCHQIMRKNSLQNQFLKSTEQETCFQCHRTIRAQTYRSSHMPIREGKITCANCHNPHGTPNQSLLKEATANDVCYGCHAEKRGPFLWEHPPVRENCMNCHDPHGSMHDFLLKVSMPRLCQQCHSVVGHPGTPHNPNVQFAFNRACANCHSAVHGSNAPGGVRFHR